MKMIPFMSSARQKERIVKVVYPMDIDINDKYIRKVMNEEIWHSGKHFFLETSASLNCDVNDWFDYYMGGLAWPHVELSCKDNSGFHLRLTNSGDCSLHTYITGYSLRNSSFIRDLDGLFSDYVKSGCPKPNLNSVEYIVRRARDRGNKRHENAFERYGFCWAEDRS